MRTIQYTIPAEYSGKKLLVFLKNHINLSTAIIRVLRNKENTCFVNGEHHRVIDPVFEGDVVTLKIPEKTEPPLLWDEPINIIYEDKDLLIVNKPSGVATHPTAKHPNFTLCNAVANYLIKECNLPAAGRAVGRLDKVTSGVTVFAKNTVAASLLNGKLQKKYLAVVWGEVPESGTVDAPIFRPDMGKTTRSVDPRGDRAITHFKRLACFDGKSFCEITTETGRTHQIRVHFNHIGHPLVGDEIYGASSTANLRRAALHCSEITLTHPVTKTEMTFTAPLPEDMENELKGNL